MKSRIFFSVFFVMLFFVGNTQNLVPNPSFEIHKELPCHTIRRKVDLEKIFDDWYLPTEGTSDIFSTKVDSNCYAYYASNHSLSSGKTKPRTGDVMAGIWTYNKVSGNGELYREYLGTPLTSSLIKGHKYYVEFYVSLADSSYYGHNNIGAYFSVNKVDESFSTELSVIPQINEDEIITKAEGWRKISGEFIADQAYKHLVIGHFFDNKETKIYTYHNLFNSQSLYSWYDIDDVLVKDITCLQVSKNDTICSGDIFNLSVIKSDSPFIGWATEKNPKTILSKELEFKAFPLISTTYLAYSECDTIPITVTVIPYPVVELGNDTTLCHQDVLNLKVKLNPSIKYLWQDSLLSNERNITNEGLYWLESTNWKCKTRDSINVNYYPSLVKSWNDDTILCHRESLFLDAQTPNATYLWQDFSTNSIYEIIEDGLYWVEVTNSECSFIDSVQVELDYCKVIIDMPNIFTPNNDQVNDSFEPTNFEGIKEAIFIIYNRWGKEVFRTSNLSQGWKGKNNEKMCSDGIYFWNIEYKGLKEQEGNLKGYVMLIR